MTYAWIDALVWIFLAALAAGAFTWLHVRLRNLESDHFSLVEALNKAGAGLHHTGTGYVSTLRTPAPLANQPGELFDAATPNPPTMRAMQRASHALRDPILSAPPPVPDGVRDWLLHYSRRNDVTWASVVAEFYRRAAADPEIAAYFVNANMERQQKHFTATMIIVTREGISASTVQAMRHAHHGITDKSGNPLHITGAVFDRTIDVLAEVLRDSSVPAEAIAALAGTIAPLRDAIVCEA